MKYFYFSVGGLSFLGIIGVVILLFCQSNKMLSSEEKNLLVFYQTNTYLNDEFSGQDIIDIQCQYKDTVLSISYLVKNKPRLIYRYSDNHCSSCIRNELPILKKYFSSQISDVLFVSSYSSKAPLTDFIKKNLIKFEVCRIIPEAFTWEVEHYGRPYFFILYPNLKATNFYLPDVAFPNLSESYIKNAKQIIDNYPAL